MRSPTGACSSPLWKRGGQGVALVPSVAREPNSKSSPTLLFQRRESEPTRPCALTDTCLQFPPLEKGGRGDSLWLHLLLESPTANPPQSSFSKGGSQSCARPWALTDRRLQFPPLERGAGGICSGSICCSRAQEQILPGPPFPKEGVRADAALRAHQQMPQPSFRMGGSQSRRAFAQVQTALHPSPYRARKVVSNISKRGCSCNNRKQPLTRRSVRWCVRFEPIRSCGVVRGPLPDESTRTRSMPVTAAPIASTGCAPCRSWRCTWLAWRCSEWGCRRWPRRLRCMQSACLR